MIKSFFPIFNYLRKTSKIPNFVADPVFQTSSDCNIPAPLFLKPGLNPVYKHYLDLPLVYQNSNTWMTQILPVSTNIPFFVKSFVLTFDFYKKANKSFLDISDIELSAFRFKVVTAQNKFLVLIKLSLDYHT